MFQKMCIRDSTWAEAMGMNTMRVFLHDLLWQQDAAGFQKRINQFLTIASRITFVPYWCSSILVGIHCRTWVRSTPRFQASTIQAGFRVPAPLRSGTPPNTHDLRRT